MTEKPVAGPAIEIAPLPLTLFAAGQPAVAAKPRFCRFQLDPCCWVDRVEGFIEGADSLFADVADRFEWFGGKRLMYGTWYDEPRLTAKLELGESTVPPVIEAAAELLASHYGRKFSGLFCNYYRSGRDGVAWHADRIGRTAVDPLVAIVSLGGPRTFAIRDKSTDVEPSDPVSNAGPPTRSRRWQLFSGDLLVMGGATQHHWEHAVPKAIGAPPRISLTTRAG